MGIMPSSIPQFLLSNLEDCMYNKPVTNSPEWQPYDISIIPTQLVRSAPVTKLSHQTHANSLIPLQIAAMHQTGENAPTGCIHSLRSLLRVWTLLKTVILYIFEIFF
jgi:hypothetical protein